MKKSITRYCDPHDDYLAGNFKINIKKSTSFIPLSRCMILLLGSSLLGSILYRSTISHTYDACSYVVVMISGLSSRVVMPVRSRITLVAKGVPSSLRSVKNTWSDAYVSSYAFHLLLSTPFLSLNLCTWSKAKIAVFHRFAPI